MSYKELARERIENHPALQPYREELLADLGDKVWLGENFYKWVATAPVQSVVNFANGDASWSSELLFGPDMPDYTDSAPETEQYKVREVAEFDPELPERQYSSLTRLCDTIRPDIGGNVVLLEALVETLALWLIDEYGGRLGSLGPKPNLVPTIARLLNTLHAYARSEIT